MPTVHAPDLLIRLYAAYEDAHPEQPLRVKYTKSGESGVPADYALQVVAWALRTERLTPGAAAEVLDVLATVLRQSDDADEAE